MKIDIKKVSGRNRRTPRYVQTVPPSDKLWAIYKVQSPAYLSAYKFLHNWTFSVWGDTPEECRANVADLIARLADVVVVPPRPVERIRVRRGPVKKPGQGRQRKQPKPAVVAEVTDY